MTMYRMRQRELILGLLAATLELRRSLLDLAERHRETIFAVHTHTQRAQPTTVAHYLLAVVEQLERDGTRLKAAYERTNRSPLGACAITGTGFPIDRSLTADLLGFSAPTGNTYGSIATVDYLLESTSAAAVLLVGARPVRSGFAAVVHLGVRLRAARRRVRAVQQHHAAEAQSGGHRACARNRQQGARPGAGDSDERPQHPLRRHRRYRGRPAAARALDVPRRDPHREAGGGGDGDGASSTRLVWSRGPPTDGRR